jgi:hypothetical protein
MMLDLLDPATLGRLIGIISLMIMGSAIGYAKGFKDGRREGFARGKSVSIHAALNGMKSRKAVK